MAGFCTSFRMPMIFGMELIKGSPCQQMIIGFDWSLKMGVYTADTLV
jgi:hypothetical protein